MHRSLVKKFFRNASRMLRATGEVHVSHKKTAPFSNWNIEELANESYLSLIACPEFKIEDYPGYNNKRGNGLKCDDPFPLGECCTFIFGFFPAGKKSGGMSSKGFSSRRSQILQEIPFPIQNQEILFDSRYPHTISTTGIHEFLASLRLSIRLNNQRERPMIFDSCFNSVRENFGGPGNDLGYSVHESPGFDSFRHPQASFTRNKNYLGLPLARDIQIGNARVYDYCFNNANETLRRDGNDVGYHVRESVIASERYMAEAPGFQRENARIYAGCFNNVNETPRRVGNDVGYSVDESLIPFRRRGRSTRKNLKWL
ncbi:DUF2431 domain-containing protein [Melia azedarach]|uniref:DUF2431 domain-containing protein n=1 Tax=Melia azedarach TaxID=155640 RepID=A0ACC1YPT1_MELAZ|nr:DUF2431 domain-containing protein [Melia azedarach]